MNDFCHLHVHTDASRIDGLGVVERLVTGAKSRGFTRLAMTDHGSLANTITFISACENQGIKPIVGLEGYVQIDGVVGHITLLADGNLGFKSLVEINNAGHRGSFTRPAFDFDTLVANNEGLLLLTGCVASHFHSMDVNDALTMGRKLKAVFGSRMFAEIMFVSETPTWERSLQLSKDLRIPLVTTNDAHFAYPTDADVHKILVQLKAGFNYESKFLFLATADEILKRISERGHTEVYSKAQAGLNNAALIGSKIKSVNFSGVPSLPHIENAEQQLRNLVDASIKKKSEQLHWTESQVSEVRARANYELSIIEEMQYATYFLILFDMVNFARGSNIRVGPGRGSGAGSVVLFLIDVTEINPLTYDLSFERFLNPKRKGMPDVDVDFDSEGRPLVIRYAMDRWSASPVATYSRYSHKMLIHDLCKYFRLPRDIENRAIDEDENGISFRQLCSMQPLFEPTYDAMMGQIRHMGQHAGGIIITNAPVPLERTSGAERSLAAAWTEGETKELTAAGVVKYDILALSALSILKRLEQKHGRRAPDLENNDPVFQLFQKGDLGGIFQFSGSSGIVDYTKKVSPSTFEDIVAINALYRPGALDAGTAKHYPEWRKKPRSIHPLVDPILKSTYGVIVYQEQTQAIFAALTDGDLASADEARKAISKTKPGDPKWEAQLAELGTKLYDGALSKGVPEETVELLWKEILAHTRYSFNKSHSVSYAKIACDMAWWKYYHRLDFYCALLTVDIGEAQRYIFEVVQSGIEIVPPHVNISSVEYETDGTRIYMPLSVIKHLGTPGVAAIINGKPFSSIADFMNRIPKKLVKSRARLGLWQLGAFEGVDGVVDQLQIKMPEAMTKTQKHMAYMGFMIPPRRALEAVNKARREGYVAGVIAQRVLKESSYGKYCVYYLLPQGSVWSRDHMDLEVGKWVKIKHRKNSGRILSVQPLK